LHVKDCDPAGFRWSESNDAEASVYAWLRFGNDGDAPILIACNFTPVERGAYRIGVPGPGLWSEALNTDAAAYGGGNRGNLGGREAQAVAHNGFDWSIEAVLPPLATVFFRQQA